MNRETRELVFIAKELVGMVTPSVLRRWEDLTDKFREKFSGWGEGKLPVEVLYNENFFIALLQYQNGRYELEVGYPIHFGLSAGGATLTKAQYDTIRADIVRGMVAVFGQDKVMAHIEKYNLPSRYSRVDWKRLVYG